LATAPSGTAKRTSSSPISSDCSQRGDRPRCQRHATHASATPLTSHDMRWCAPMFSSISWMPNDTLAASMIAANCSMSSFSGFSACPGAKLTPTPPGVASTCVPCATDTTAPSARAAAKVVNARFSPSLTCARAGASTGATQQPTSTTTATSSR
jgi:hypothetical protein